MNRVIKVIDSKIETKEEGRGNGFSFIATSKYTVYGCHASPNKEIEELAETLEIKELAETLESRFIRISGPGAREQ